jgi:radical SAM protein with 4Fe4S-binding SPASM domain
MPVSAIFRRMQAAYMEAGRLLNVHVDVLYQCDLDCAHCYLDKKSVPLHPTSFWLDVIDQAAEAGALAMTFSGGEIFLRRDIFELIARARQHGLLVTLKSHAGQVQDSFVERLVELGVTRVSVSYYSTDPAIHDAITRVPGSHARTLDAMTRLARTPVVVEATCIVMKPNLGCYRAVAEQCEALGFGIDLQAYLRVAQSGARFPQDLALDPADLVAFYAFRSEPSRRTAGCGVQGHGLPWEEERNCHAGHSGLYVDPKGRVSPCVNWPMFVADLAAGDRLAEVHDRDPRILAIKASRKGERADCRDCGVKEACFFCPGQAWQETGDPHRATQYHCENGYAMAAGEAVSRGSSPPERPATLGRPKFAILSARASP